MASAALLGVPTAARASSQPSPPSLLPSKFLNPNPTKPMTPPPPLILTRFSSSSPPPPDTDCPVPFDQQPLNEYETLAASVPFSWASADLRRYVSRLLITGASFSLFVGLPVAGFGVLDPGKEALRCALGALSAGLLAVTLAVVRIYLGWAYVGNRLLSATVECNFLLGLSLIWKRRWKELPWPN